MSHCPRCGTANAPSNQVCIACAAPLPFAAPPGYPPVGAPPQGAGTPNPYAGVIPPPGGYAPQQGHGHPGQGQPGQGQPQGLPPGYAPQYPPAAPPVAYANPPAAAPAAFPPGAPGGYPQGTPAPYYSPPTAASASAPRGSQPDRASVPGTKIVGFLVSFETNEQGEFWVLRAGQLRVGRKDAAEGLAVAIDHPTVSSNHAVLTLDPEAQQFLVEDLRSANGTVLNGRAIAGQGPRELRDGDRVRFGGFSATLKLID